MSQKQRLQGFQCTVKIHLIRTYELSEFFIVKENYLHNIEFCLSKSDVALIFYSLSCTKKLIHNVIINSLRQLRNFVFIVHPARARVEEWNHQVVNEQRWSSYVESMNHDGCWYVSMSLKKNRGLRWFCVRFREIPPDFRSPLCSILCKTALD